MLCGMYACVPLQVQHGEAEEAVARLEAERERLNAELDTTQSDLGAARMRIHELQAQLSDLRSTTETGGALCDDLNRRVASLDGQMQWQAQALEAAELEADGLRSQLALMQGSDGVGAGSAGRPGAQAASAGDTKRITELASAKAEIMRLRLRIAELEQLLAQSGERDAAEEQQQQRQQQQRAREVDAGAAEHVSAATGAGPHGQPVFAAPVNSHYQATTTFKIAAGNDKPAPPPSLPSPTAASPTPVSTTAAPGTSPPPTQASKPTGKASEPAVATAKTTAGLLTAAQPTSSVVQAMTGGAGATATPTGPAAAQSAGPASPGSSTAAGRDPGSEASRCGKD